MAAAKIVGQRGYKGAQRQIEEVVLGKRHKNMDFSETRAFFEAYGSIAGNAGVAPLAAMLIPRGLFRQWWEIATGRFATQSPRPSRPWTHDRRPYPFARD